MKYLKKEMQRQMFGIGKARGSDGVLHCFCFSCIFLEKNVSNNNIYDTQLYLANIIIFWEVIWDVI